MNAMLLSVTPCFRMPSCLIIGASSSQQQVISCASFIRHSIFALCWDSISSKPMWLTIISVMFFHLWSYPSIYFNKLLALVHSSFNVLIPALTILTSYIFILYKSSTSTPRRAGPKPSVLAVPTSWLLLFSMDLQHSCTCSHHLWAPWTKGKCPPCFIPALCPCWILWSTVWGIRMSNWPWRIFWTWENIDE